MSIEPVMLSNHLIFCHPLILSLSIFPSIGSFPMSQLFPAGDQSIGASASASVLPMNTQGQFPLGLTSSPHIPRDSEGSSLAPQFKSINSLAHSLLYGLTRTFIHDYWANHSFDYMALSSKMMSLIFNMLFGFIIAFFPRSKCLLISLLAVTICGDFGAKKTNLPLLTLFPHLFDMMLWDWMP